MKTASDLNIQDADGYTPLHHAVSSKLRRATTLLLNGNADPNKTDKDGFLPLEIVINDSKPDDKLGEILVRKMKNSRFVISQCAHDVSCTPDKEILDLTLG